MATGNCGLPQEALDHVDFVVGPHSGELSTMLLEQKGNHEPLHWPVLPCLPAFLELEEHLRGAHTFLRGQQDALPGRAHGEDAVPRRRPEPLVDREQEGIRTDLLERGRAASDVR